MSYVSAFQVLNRNISWQNSYYCETEHLFCDYSCAHIEKLFARFYHEHIPLYTVD
jgi:hypothetical protein